MKKIIVSLIIIFGITGIASALGAGVYMPIQGGTGIGNVPSYGQVLVGNSGGTYTLTATSSLGISSVVSTSTNETAGNLSYWTSNSATPAMLGKVATTTLTLTNFPANIPATLGALVGGSNTTWNWWGLATTSQPASSNLLTSNGTSGVYGTATSTLTASSPLTGSFTQVGSGGSVGCQTASGSQAGCLSSANWTTFNNKQATISATWPITLSGATVGFNGLSTSTAAVNGNIPYFSGVNTFANVATTSIGAGTGLTFSGTAGAQIGGVAGTYSVNTSQNITTLSNLTTNGYIKTSGGIGTLGVQTVPIPVADGGTGQTSFGQGWLNSDGTAITSSTSPTVNYLTATSTTATSTIERGGLAVGTTTPFGNGLLTVGTSSPLFYIDRASGNVGIGTTSPNSRLDVSDGVSIILGADNNAYSRTNSTIKAVRLTLPHYTNTQANFAFFTANSQSAINGMSFGGGSAAFNAATQLQFFTAANNTTLAGTERMRIDSNGLVSIGTTTPWSKLSISNTYGSQQTLFEVSTSTNASNSATSSLFKIDARGHISASSTAPTLTSCGTSPTLDGTDFAGTVYPGATASGCTVTFANIYAKAPHCAVTPQTGSIVNTFTYTISTTAITVTETGLTNFDYVCVGF